LHPDRLFPAEPAARALARELYGEVADLPIVSPHGHTDPSWHANASS
jgi:glucuronate isomerase